MASFCQICGTLIRRKPPHKEDLEWYHEVRAVRRETWDADPNLTGVGYLDTSNRMRAPLDAEHSYKYVEASSLKTITKHFTHSASSCVFIIHSACWGILLQQMGGEEGNKDFITRLAASFLNMLCDHWHDLPGGDALRDPIYRGDPMYRGNPYYWNEGGYRGSDPLQFRNVAHVLDYLCSTPLKEMGTPAITGGGTGSDIFSKLPAEVIHLVLESLPTEDITRLRLASRPIACLSHPTSLSRRFWLSRFFRGYEMGFALPTDDSISQDWAGLYFALKQMLKEEKGHDYLRNRKVIWDLISRCAPTLQLYMRGMELQGESISSSTFQSLDQPPIPTAHAPPGSIRPFGKAIASQLPAPDSIPLDLCRRKRMTKTLEVPLWRYRISTVGISTVVYNGQVFISGLRMVLSHLHVDAQKTYCIGYLAPNLETVIDIAPDEKLVGFKLAVRADGITGMRIITSAGGQNSESTWVGDIGNRKHNVAFGSVFMEPDTNTLKLAARFDVCRMAALAILSDTQTPEPRRLILQPLWTPSRPADTSSTSPIHFPENQTFSPILNIDFGGNDGENLQKLTRIVAHMDSSSVPIVGLAFEFDGLDTLFFGKQGLMEVSFFVDGCGGERIEEVICRRTRAANGISSLRFRTNLGRTVHFAQDEFSITLAGRPKDGDEEYTLCPPEGSMITGLTAVFGSTNGGFQTLGLQHSPISDPLAQLVGSSTAQMIDWIPEPSFFDGTSAPELCLTAGFRLMQIDDPNCMGYTHADLDGVRRIRFSAGSADRPRRWSEVSGLWLEYSDPQKRPAVLGQWIREVDSISLEANERVTEVHIWISRLMFDRSEGYSLGRVVRLTILTSLNKARHFPSVDGLKKLGASNQLVFRENRLQKLKSIAWAFNHRWDHPRVFSSPINDSDRFCFWSPQFDGTAPRWMVPDKVLFKETDAQGDGESRLCRVAAYQFQSDSPSSRTPPYITGLEFAYTNLLTVKIGATDGLRSDDLSLELTTMQLAKVELLSNTVGVLDIVFHLKGPGAQEAHTVALLSRQMPKTTIYREVLDITARTYEKHAVKARSKIQLKASKTLPAGEAVGLWGFARGEKGLNLGIMYLEQSEGENPEGNSSAGCGSSDVGVLL